MIEGLIEVIRPFQIRGWAYDTNAPDEPVTVTLTVGGEEIVSNEATIFRGDLLDAGKGDGHHGFVFNLDFELPTEAPELIEVCGQSARGTIGAVPQALNAIIADPAVSSARAAQKSSPIVGYFELVPPSTIRGWAYNPKAPDEHLTVEIFVHGQRIGLVIADQFRADLVLAMVGAGDHGFLLHFDEPLPAAESTLEVVARWSMSSASGTLELETVSEPEGIRAAAAARPTIRFPRDIPACAHHPVFILGAARSGTSAVAQSLLRATRYRGHEEGHLLDLIAPMLQSVARHYREHSDEWAQRPSTMIAEVSQDFFEEGIRHIFVELARTLFPEGWWLDKTPRPSMIAAAPLLRQIWPEAKFIFMKRRAIENIVSRMTKFPAVPFEDHCRDWAWAMQAWMGVRDTLGGAAIEIDQLYLATHPEEVAAALAPVLFLEPQEVSGFAQLLAVERPERTARRFAAVISSATLPWTDAQRKIFSSICGISMEAYGYDSGETYFARGREDAGLVGFGWTKRTERLTVGPS